MNLFDSHCHLENGRFESDLPDVMARMKDAGVSRCILAGSDMETSEQIVKMASEYPDVYGVVGIHPHDAKTWTDDCAARLAEWVKEERIVGIGEIGLDYYYDHSPRDVQKEVFEKQLLLARELNMPAVFHVRDAHGDVLDILRKNRAQLPDGVVHCYSGSVESAREYLDMGFYISFAGPITFKNANKLLDVAKYVPLDRILVETDSPYLPPVPHRGKMNYSGYMHYTLEAVADIRNKTPEDMAAITVANTCRLFGITL